MGSHRYLQKNRNGKIIGRISTQVFNDGGSAGEWNIAAISWNDDSVIVVLRDAEMKDKEITIAYKKVDQILSQNPFFAVFEKKKGGVRGGLKMKISSLMRM